MNSVAESVLANRPSRLFAPAASPVEADALLAALDPSFRAHTQALLLIGSHNEGFSNAYSDIDVLLLTDAVGQEAIRGTAGKPVFVDDKRVDIIIMSVDEVRAFLHVAMDDIDNAILKDLELVHKIAHARVLHDQGTYAALLGDFDYARFSERVASKYLAFANDQYTFLAGQLAEGDRLMAADAARTLVQLHVEAYLARLGDTYPKTKWRMRKMQRQIHAGQPIFHAVCEAEFCAPYRDPQALVRWTNHSLSTVRKLQAGIFFGQGLLDALDAANAAGPADTIAMHPLLSVERLASTYVMRLPERSLAIDRAMALVLLSHAWPVSDDTRRAALARHAELPIEPEEWARRAAALIRRGMLIDTQPAAEPPSSIDTAASC
ncbi:hypothetical protein LA03_31065 [Burkholderia gladioli]|uniref:hypothetical protein n=1 Tax=Burkholderia gladioli TaxID=28095 RepID=UPI00050E27CD|nr:hypothetical protein [Burkholderia gladioli]KGE06569.1 hypothetical protein LA03_31065 [Burkholderia gladioli]